MWEWGGLGREVEEQRRRRAEDQAVVHTEAIYQSGITVLRSSEEKERYAKTQMIIAIDGPAGSGKSTTARAVAERLGYLYLDTGAMYRAVALAFLRAGAEPTPEGAEALLPQLRLDVRHEGGAMHVVLGGEDVTGAIRTQDVGGMASRVSALPQVRERLVREQQRTGQAASEAGGGVVLDGRDIGTVVFPEADVKVFMVADADVRARRRVEELAARGEKADVADVRAEIQERDARDQARAVSPLRRAQDALVLDSTHYSIGRTSRGRFGGHQGTPKRLCRLASFPAGPNADLHLCVFSLGSPVFAYSRNP